MTSVSLHTRSRLVAVRHTRCLRIAVSPHLFILFIGHGRDRCCGWRNNALLAGVCIINDHGAVLAFGIPRCFREGWPGFESGERHAPNFVSYCRVWSLQEKLWAFWQIFITNPHCLTIVRSQIWWVDWVEDDLVLLRKLSDLLVDAVLHFPGIWFCDVSHFSSLGCFLSFSLLVLDFLFILVKIVLSDFERVLWSVFS